MLKDVLYKMFIEKSEWKILLKIIGEKSLSDEIVLKKDNLVTTKQVSAANTNGKAYLQTFKFLNQDVGKVKQVNWLLAENLHESDEYFINELHLKIPFRNELLM